MTEVRRKRADQLLDSIFLDREIFGLISTYYARLLLAAVGMFVVLFFAVDTFDYWVRIVHFALMIIFSIGYIRKLNCGLCVKSSVIFALVMDISLIVTTPWLFYYVLDVKQHSFGILLKTPLPYICFALIVSNALALNPVYPAVMTLVSVLTFAVLGILAFNDPRVEFTSDLFTGSTTSAINTAEYFIIIIITIIIGAFITFITHMFRKTVKGAIEKQSSINQLQERQNQLILDSKMESINQIVSSIAHEINNPNASIMSANDVMIRSMAKYASADEENAREKCLKIFEDNSSVVHQASRRIKDTVRLLKNFAHLDEASFQLTSIRECLNDSLYLVKNQFSQNIEVEDHYSDKDIKAYCSPGTINQVFFNILKNAYEAMPEGGKLNISLKQSTTSTCTISITDTGPGMTQEQIDNAFKIGFQNRDNRMKTKMGLPLSQNIIQQHKGKLNIDSISKEGTRVHIELSTVVLDVV